MLIKVSSFGATQAQEGYPLTYRLGNGVQD